MRTRTEVLLVVVIAVIALTALSLMGSTDDDSSDDSASDSHRTSDDATVRYNYRITYADSFRADNGRTYSSQEGMQWAVVTVRAIDDGPYDLSLDPDDWAWDVVAGGQVYRMLKASTYLRDYSDATIAPSGAGMTARVAEIPSSAKVTDLRTSYDGSAKLALDRSITVPVPDLGASPDVYYNITGVSYTKIGDVDYVMVGMVLQNNTSHSIDMTRIKADVDGMADNLLHYSSTNSHMLASGAKAIIVLYGCYNQGDVMITKDTELELSYTTLKIYGTTFARSSSLTA